MLHKLEFDGYGVGERVLDMFIYHVFIETNGQEAKVVNITFDETYAPAHDYVDAVKEDVETKIENLKTYLVENDLTFDEDFKNWERDSNEKGVQLLFEY